jgi:hypothetical protein
MIWISTKPYITHMEGINAYVNKYKVVEMRKVAAEPHWISG